MSLIFNGTNITSSYNLEFNGTALSKLWFKQGSADPVLVWEKDVNPFYFTSSKAADQFGIKMNGSGVWTGSYSRDGSNWTDITLSGDGDQKNFSLSNVGDKIYFKGSYTSRENPIVDYIQFISPSIAQLIASGNVMTLLQGDNPTTDLSDTYFAFRMLFHNLAGLRDASNLELPATTLGEYCYQTMFYECSALITPPALPATTLAKECYANMFNACTSLTTVPALPAETLADYCYAEMFQGCTSLAVNTSGTYEWRIPTTGTGTVGTDSLRNMLYDTAGTVTAPSINTTYYVENQPIS